MLLFTILLTDLWLTGWTPTGSVPIRVRNPWCATFLRSSLFLSSKLREFNLPSENPPIHMLCDLLAVSVSTRLLPAPAAFVSFLRSPPGECCLRCLPLVKGDSLE